MSSGRRIAILVAFIGSSLAAGCNADEQQASPSRPALTIVSFLPREGVDEPRTDAMVAAIRAEVANRQGRAGPHRIRYVDADSADPTAGIETEDFCESTAADLADDRRIVAVIGPLTSACARFLVPNVNLAGLAVVSPTVDLPGLTHQVPGSHNEKTCFECSPARFYPSGERNFVRLLANIDSEGRAAARLFADLGANRVHILSDGEAFHTKWLEAGLRDEAKSVGITVTGTTIYGATPAKIEQATRSLAPRADALYLLAPSYAKGGEVLQSTRRTFAGPIVSSLTIVDEALVRGAGASADGLFLTSTRLPREALPEAARRFAAAIGERENVADAIYAAEAAGLVLDAISHSDGTRPGIRRAIFDEARSDLLGDFSVDPNGDVQPQRVPVFEVRGKKLVHRMIIEL